MTRASKIPSSEWESHKSTIRAYYKDHSLKELHDFMLNTHGFNANEKQYKRQLKIWGFRRYVSGEDMSLLIKHNASRHLASGKTVTESQKKRYLRRHRNSQQATSQDAESLHDTAASLSASMGDTLDDDLLQPILIGRNGLPYSVLDNEDSQNVMQDDGDLMQPILTLATGGPYDSIQNQEPNIVAAPEGSVRQVSTGLSFQEHDSQVTTVSHTSSDGHSQHFIMWQMMCRKCHTIHDTIVNSSGEEQCPNHDKASSQAFGFYAGPSNTQDKHANSAPDPAADLAHQFNPAFSASSSMPNSTVDYGSRHGRDYDLLRQFSIAPSTVSMPREHHPQQNLDIGRFTDDYVKKQDSIKFSLIQLSSIIQVFRGHEDSHSSQSNSSYHQHLARLERVIDYQRNLTHAYSLMIRLAKYGVLNDMDHSFMNQVVKPTGGWHASSVADLLTEWIESYPFPL